jgi:hypothetical protein
MVTKQNIVNGLTISYFIIALLEVVSEYAMKTFLICLLKPLLTIFLLLLYWVESKEKKRIVLLVLFFSLITNILFIPNTQKLLFYAILAFTAHRIFAIYLIFSIQKIQDFVPTVIATIPFLLIFFYLFSETPGIPSEAYELIILQNILISILAGVSLASYVMNDNKCNSVLLISALLFVMLQFTVFIEKYFLTNEYQQFFRPLAMSFNTLAFFAFYKYIILAEKIKPQ